MEAFSTHRRIFQLMCIFPLPDESSVWERMIVFMLGIATTLSQILALLTSIVYVLNVSTDIADSVKTVFQIAAYMNSSYLMCVAFLKRNHMLHIVNKFQRIYDASMCYTIRFIFFKFYQLTFTDHDRTSINFLRSANDMSEKIVVFFLRTSVIFFLTTFALGIALIAYCYVINGRFDSDELFLLYNYA